MQSTVDHLFRHESGKLVAVLTRIFGVHNLELAEDVVQDTLLKACTQWAFSGIPENPTAWLFRVARNQALDHLRRKKHEKAYAASIAPILKSEYTAASAIENMLLETELHDDQLRMMFACCHPALPPDAQVALTLKTLCGFSAAEISRAFLTSEDTINKRLYRGREKLRELRAEFEIPSGEGLRERLTHVTASVYLLFNEGYNSTQHDLLIRKDLIDEAIRLSRLIMDHPVTGQPEIRALLALMLFHNARTAARLDENGEIILLENQDRSKWDREQIAEASALLEASAEGQQLTVYHIEAAIAWNHAVAGSWENTDWHSIVALYDLLMRHDPSPVIALNRAIALAQDLGPKAGLEALENIPEQAFLADYYLYHAAAGDFHFRLGRQQEALEALQRAAALTRSPAEIRLLRKKMEACTAAH